MEKLIRFFAYASLAIGGVIVFLTKFVIEDLFSLKNFVLYGGVFLWGIGTIVNIVLESKNKKKEYEKFKVRLQEDMKEWIPLNRKDRFTRCSRYRIRNDFSIIKLDDKEILELILKYLQKNEDGSFVVNDSVLHFRNLSFEYRLKERPFFGYHKEVKQDLYWTDRAEIRIITKNKNKVIEIIHTEKKYYSKHQSTTIFFIPIFLIICAVIIGFNQILPFLVIAGILIGVMFILDFFIAGIKFKSLMKRATMRIELDLNGEL
ncbi:MAG: hypothetical protein MI922_04055 [Bacteroidales bacterium]|nr:hypothetical protein [Bacteroidales bacterium]